MSHRKRTPLQRDLRIRLQEQQCLLRVSQSLSPDRIALRIDVCTSSVVLARPHPPSEQSHRLLGNAETRSDGSPSSRPPGTVSRLSAHGARFHSYYCFSIPITIMGSRRSRFIFLPSIACLPLLLLLLLFFSSLPVTCAQSLSAVTVLPSNNSQDLVWTGILRFDLHSSQVELPPVVHLAPLSRSLVTLSQDDFTVSCSR